MLEVRGLQSGYGAMTILHGVDLDVRDGEVVCLLGSNGAGKSTLLRTLSGLLTPSEGHITFKGQPIAGFAPEKVVRLGLGHVAEGRELFGDLTVAQNLRLGSYASKMGTRELAETRDFVFGLFPVLHEKSELRASALSGGEQQMLALGRALMGGPRMLLLDEPSLGLAPLMTMRIFEVVRELKKIGVPVLIVEQNASAVLGISDRGYVLEHGKMVAEGPAEDLRRDDVIRANYLGM